MTRVAIGIACATAVFGLGGSSHAQQAAIALPVQAIYVGEFRPAEAPRSGFGPLHALTSGIHTRRVDENAEKLSGALVRALRNHDASAETLPADVLPRSGWIVRGVFYSLDSDNHLLSVPFLNSNRGPNVEVTVTIANAANDPNTPFAVIGTDAALKGRGLPVGWNPYVVAARFVIQKVEGDRSIDELAEQIAVKILDSRAALDHHDPAQQR